MRPWVKVRIATGVVEEFNSVDVTPADDAVFRYVNLSADSETSAYVNLAIFAAAHSIDILSPIANPTAFVLATAVPVQWIIVRTIDQVIIGNGRTNATNIPPNDPGHDNVAVTETEFNQVNTVIAEASADARPSSDVIWDDPSRLAVLLPDTRPYVDIVSPVSEIDGSVNAKVTLSITKLLADESVDTAFNGFLNLPISGSKSKTNFSSGLATHVIKSKGVGGADIVITSTVDVKVKTPVFIEVIYGGEIPL